MVNWDASDIQEFKKYARTAQQEYYDLLGDRDWDEISCWNWNIFRRKIGFGMYGPPPNEPNDSNRNTGYNSDQLKVIEDIGDQLVDGLNFKNRSIRFACIFVIMKVHENRYTVPIFKAEEGGKIAYVDTSARKYSSWGDYLNNNKLQKCIYCYPTTGYYKADKDGDVRVSFGTSPACDLSSRIFRFLDVTSTVVTVAATGVGVVALCAIPVAGPIMAASAVAGATTGVYGVTRSAGALVDRATHSQSIALTDPEARGCWISIVGSSLGFAQGRMIASMSNAARAGEVMGKAGRIAFLVVQGGSLTVNGIGIIHGLAAIIDKSERNELTTLDVFQFSASVLFFTNSVINVKTASTIIKEVQHDVIDSHRQQLSPEAKKLFNKQTGRLRGPREMHGNAEVVKQLNNIENSRDLYEMMSNKNVDSHKVKLTPDGFKGLLEVNKNLKVAPLKMLEIPPQTRETIFNATKEYANKTITQENFHAKMRQVCREHKIRFESMRAEARAKLCEIFGKDSINSIDVGGKKIFANATPHEIDRLKVVLENTAQDNKTIIELATEYAKRKGASNAKDYITSVETFVADLNENVASLVENNNMSRAQAKQAALNQYGTRDGDQMKFVDKGYKDLNARVEAVKSEVAPLNKACKPSFFNDDLATYHYLKHKKFNVVTDGVGTKVELTTAEYFQVCQEVTGNPTNQTNSMLSQDGSCTMVTYIDPQRGVRAIIINREGSSGIATVMYDEKVHQPNK